jgi:hypothetical protein
MRHTWILTGAGLALLGFATGCREPDRPAGPLPGAGIVVDSDPRGAHIELDRQNTGRVTPDTLSNVTRGLRELVVRMTVGGLTYGYRTNVSITAEDSLVVVNGPLLLGCQTGGCIRSLTRFYASGDTRLATMPLGPLFHVEGQGEGIQWPSGTGNSYASVGSALFAGLAGSSRDTVALGPYDFLYLAGRPTPTVSEGPTLLLRHSSWVLPPPGQRLLSTVRGLSVDYSVLARAETSGTIIVRLVFRNITTDPVYRFIDPLVPAEGLTYHSAYVGFALDGDVGIADDDAISYVRDLDMVLTYDSDFLESSFSGGWATRPALLGLRLLERPAGTTVHLNSWPRGWDWEAGQAAVERAGWYWMSGTQTWLGNHADPRIGYAPQDPQDLRMSVSAGPLQLAPGDSAAITLAVVLAEPAPGTFTSGTRVSPGDPLDQTRPLTAIAAPLIARALAAESVAASLLEP